MTWFQTRTIFLVSSTSLDATEDTEADMSTINNISDVVIRAAASQAISAARKWGVDPVDLIEQRLRCIGVRLNMRAESTDGHDLVEMGDGRWLRYAPHMGPDAVIICD